MAQAESLPLFSTTSTAAATAAVDEAGSLDLPSLFASLAFASICAPVMHQSVAEETEERLNQRVTGN